MYKITANALGAAVALGVALGAFDARAQETIELKFADGVPEQVHFNKDLFIPWAKKVEADSEGTLKISFFFAGSLGKEGQLVEVVDSGAADIALDIAAYYPGRFPMTDLASLPLLVTTPEESSVALWQVYEDGLMGSGFEDMKMLAITSPPGAVFMTTDEPVTAPEDLEGRKIAGGGAIKGKMITAFGAAPINVAIADMYQSLSRGVIDTTISYYTAIPPFKLHEVVKYYTDNVPLGGSYMMVFMNKDKYDSLPEKAKEAIDKNSGAGFSQAFGQLWQAQMEVGKKMAVGAGGEILDAPEEQVAEFKTRLQPIIDEWAASVEGGEALVDAFVKARDAAK